MGEAKRRREHEQQMVALATYAVVAFEAPVEGQKRVAPTEFRLFHYGVNETMKGPFTFDERSAESTMAMYARQRVPYMGDYEHMSLVRPPIKAPASITEFVPEIRPDANGKPELWATRVQWTDEAREELEAGKYRLYSPAFMPDVDAAGVPTPDNHINYLINVALTNLPASYGLQPLVAASAAPTDRGDPAMDEKAIKEMAEKLAAAEKDREEFKALCQKMGATVLKLTGKSFDDWAKEESEEHAAGAEEANAQLTALSAFQGRILEATGKTDPAEALGVVALSITQGKELVALKQKMADDSAKALESEFTSTLDAAVAAGKIPPAGPVSKDFFISLKADFGTERALASLKKAIPGEAIVQLSAPREPAPQSAVDPMQVTIASQCAGRFGGLSAFKDAASKA
jgi:phage I-like protein